MTQAPGRATQLLQQTVTNARELGGQIELLWLTCFCASDWSNIPAAAKATGSPATSFVPFRESLEIMIRRAPLPSTSIGSAARTRKTLENDIERSRIWIAESVESLLPQVVHRLDARWRRAKWEKRNSNHANETIEEATERSSKRTLSHIPRLAFLPHRTHGRVWSTYIELYIIRVII